MSAKIANLGTNITAIQSATVDNAWTTVDAITTVSTNAIGWSPDLGTNGRLVVLPDGGSTVAAYSDNGTTFTATTVSDKQWNSIVWSSELSLFVAVGGTTGETNPVVTYSSDGTAWNTANATEAGNWSSVTWSPELGIFVAVSSTTSITNQVMYSSDGINWSTAAETEAVNWNGIAWSPKLSLFVAVASGGTNRVMTSPDGITWTGRSVPSQAWNCVTWSPELEIFCAGSLFNGSNDIMTSTNGTSWTTQTTVGASGFGFIAWAPEISLFCAGNNNDFIISTSPDGTTWTSQTIVDDGVDIVWANGLQDFFMAADVGGHVIKSNSDYSTYNQTTTIGTQGVTDMTLAANNLTLGQSARNVTIGQYASGITIGSPGVPISIGGTLMGYALIREIKTGHGGTSLAGNQVRILNNIVTYGNITTTLNTGTYRFYIDPGTYLINASAPCCGGNDHRADLKDTTNMIDYNGTNEWAYASAGAPGATRSFVKVVVTLTTNTEFYINHYIGTARGTDGLGRRVQSGVNGDFTVVGVYRLF